MQLSISAEVIINAPRHPYSLIRYPINGAKMSVPNPEPHTAIPVASDRNFSK